MDAHSDEARARARARLQQRQDRSADYDGREGYREERQSSRPVRSERPAASGARGYQAGSAAAGAGARPAQRAGQPRAQRASQQADRAGARAGARAGRADARSQQQGARAAERTGAQANRAGARASQQRVPQQAGRAGVRASGQAPAQQRSRQYARTAQPQHSPYLPYIIGAIALILIGILSGVFAPMCYSGPSANKNVNTNQNQSMSVADAPEPEPQPEEPAFDATQVDRSVLDNLIGNARTDKLLTLAQTDTNCAWALMNLDAYDELGEEIEYKLFKLMADDPAAAEFVRGCPEKWGSDPTGACDPVTPGTVPQLYQYDTRWSYYPYSRFVIGLSACGPTSICMVYQGLTGDSSLSPYDIAIDAVRNNYVHGGTDAGFYYWEADHLGLSCSDLSVSASALRSALNDGCLVIVNVGPGDFTEVGHFIVATGINGDQLTINDPFSTVRSAQTWDIDQVISQTKAMYSFSK